ncbi:hypothetical protein BJ322DRAFT_131178 [Thelephora terrestris]|uniref:Uncharacterized protein n=1 Tax=Thelephora terrestris TaxID=56493 RepID=A0A9P6HRV7_9AGAM|nr:hypothetical protein BJ322DRAFT_131178 [Thelephora terrestris]
MQHALPTLWLSRSQSRSLALCVIQIWKVSYNGLLSRQHHATATSWLFGLLLSKCLSGVASRSPCPKMVHCQTFLRSTPRRSTNHGLVLVRAPPSSSLTRLALKGRSLRLIEETNHRFDVRSD